MESDPAREAFDLIEEVGSNLARGVIDMEDFNHGQGVEDMKNFDFGQASYRIWAGQGKL